MDYINIIKKMTLIHCARGPVRCNKCSKLEKQGEKYCLIKVFLKAGNIARPMTEIVLNNEKMLCEFDVVDVFKDKKDAEYYALKNGIMIIESRHFS